jgi:thiosulfate/3-mercaptopyruvate sulfurtransferase
MVVDAGWVKQHLDDPKVAVVDTRDTPFYHGAENRQARVGRIPGAANVPFRTVMTERGRFKDPAALRGILQNAGVKPGETVVTYCHIGQQATLVWFAARLSGYPARLYDGSFQDWSARRELPVEAPALAVRDSMLLSAEWVKERLGQANIVVLHADRNRATYDSGHIAGARFADYSRYTTRRDPATNELPAPEQLVALVKELGLSYQSRIIIYGEPIPAARLYFTLDYLGLGGRASVLNGGLAAWRAAGGSISTEAPAVTATDFTPRPWTFLVVDSALVLSRLGDTATKLVDARSPDEYSGKTNAEGVRPGHIPGAANVDWTTLVRDGQFRPASELQTLFEQAGVRPEHEVVVYCQSGARASVTWFIAKYLGWRPRLYDGAMEEWGRSAGLPVER